MLVLAIESSSRDASVALLEGAQVLEQRPIDRQAGTAQRLAPEIQALLAGSGRSPADLSLIAVSAGPGSFTGLRVGVATAKTFAWALNLPVAPVDVLAAIASQAGHPQVRAAINAYRGQVFSGDYQRIDERWVVQSPVTAIDLTQWRESLQSAPCVSGPALSLLESLPAGVPTAAPERWHPTAASIGLLGIAAHAAGQSVAAADVRIAYGRVSAAEEKRS